ncbi:MAG: hypothetical protein P4L76_18055 [Beijerinckiaceae bacterium]|nr:hypothetical protein [Beijerinckiaceae bacterium]
MGLPNPPSDELSIVEWAIGGLGAVATILVGALWRVASKAGSVMTDVESLKDWKKAFEKSVDDNQRKNDQRHEENLRALGRIPDVEDFRRLEDRMDANFREIKESLGMRPRRISSE